MRWKHAPTLSEQRRAVSLTQPQTDRNGDLGRVQNRAGAAVLWELSEILSLPPEHHWKEKDSVAYEPLHSNLIIHLLEEIRGRRKQ